MTLALVDSYDVQGMDGPKYVLNEICANPYCLERASQGHHLVRRSALGGAYDWVKLPQGDVIQNKVGLCADCHDRVTGRVGGHSKAIRWEQGKAWWAQVMAYDPSRPLEYVLQRPLSTQPARLDQFPVMETTEVEACPTCGKVKRKPGPRRKVSTLSIVCPDDAEIGGEILDGWIDDFALLLGFGDAPARLKRYHVLSVVLAWAMGNKQQFVTDLKEAS